MLVSNLQRAIYSIFPPFYSVIVHVTTCNFSVVKFPLIAVKIFALCGYFVVANDVVFLIVVVLLVTK